MTACTDRSKPGTGQEVQKVFQKQIERETGFYRE